MDSELTQRERLEKIGFQEFGAWQIHNQLLSCGLESCPKGNRLLYAFSSDSQILYLGKTNRGLRQRLQGYRTPGRTQTTNIRVNQYLRNAIEDGRDIRVLAWACDGLLAFGGFRVDLAAALEDAIIRDFLPKWNMRK
jgi:hypothetical protein